MREPNPGDYHGALKTVVRLVGAVERQAGPAAVVGVGAPGSLSPLTGRVRNANSTWLNDRPLLEDLRAALGRPVRLANDADCLALSEATDGAGAGAKSVFAAILGTGVGGGVAVGGQVLEGLNRAAGEWGHTPLPWPWDDGPPPACWCGLHGCLENYLSGPGLVADHLRATGRALTSPEIIEAMRAGEPQAAATFDRYVDRLGRALAVIGDIIDPEVIVLGGGLCNVDELYARVPGVMARWMFSDVCSTPLRRAAHGDSSGVRGAAWLWP
jgi:fructokinase